MMSTRECIRLALVLFVTYAISQRLSLHLSCARVRMIQCKHPQVALCVSGQVRQNWPDFVRSWSRYLLTRTHTDVFICVGENELTAPDEMFADVKRLHRMPMSDAPSLSSLSVSYTHLTLPTICSV